MVLRRVPLLLPPAQSGCAVDKGEAGGSETQKHSAANLEILPSIDVCQNGELL